MREVPVAVDLTAVDLAEEPLLARRPAFRALSVAGQPGAGPRRIEAASLGLLVRALQFQQFNRTPGTPQAARRLTEIVRTLTGRRFSC
jgi:hypothetical protein